MKPININVEIHVINKKRRYRERRREYTIEKRRIEYSFIKNVSPLHSIYAIVLNWRINQKIGLYNITSIKYKVKVILIKFLIVKKK